MPPFLRLPHLGFLLLGLGAGLLLALPVDLTGAGCPPAGEGRDMCVVQQSLAPALTTVALCLAGGWLLADLLFVRLPELRRGDRPRRGRRREPTWGVLPPPRRPALTRGPPGLRAVGPGARPRPPAARPLRLVGGPRTAAADRAVLAACWDAASQRRARLADAAAHGLGLASQPLRAVERPHDPDPLLAAARWARDDRPPAGRGLVERWRSRFAAPPAPAPTAPICDPLLRAAVWVRIPEADGEDRRAA